MNLNLYIFQRSLFQRSLFQRSSKILPGGRNGGDGVGVVAE